MNRYVFKSLPLIRLKYLASIEMGQSPSSSEYTSEGNGLPFLQGCAEFGEQYPVPKVYCPEPNKLAKEGDILFSVRAPVGDLNVANQTFGIGRGLCAIQASQKLDDRFLWWVLHDAREQLRLVETGSTYAAVSTEDVANLRIPEIESIHQREIANYLDRETAHIDSLIQAKENLLAMLAEKRQALITQAVTRGLNPDVRLKPSGVDWLGDVPEHWEVERLKFHLKGIEQGWSPQCDNVPAEEHEWGVLKAGCVNGWDFDPNQNKRLPNDLKPIPAYEVKERDVLMSRANTRDLLGSASLVKNVRSKLMISDKLYRLNVNEANLTKEYLLMFLAIPVGRYEFEREATGASSSMQNISQDSVRNLWLPVPPKKEQLDIVAFISLETKRLDIIQKAAKQSINILRERRSALITAAVTGQIDVMQRHDNQETTNSGASVI